MKLPDALILQLRDAYDAIDNWIAANKKEAKSNKAYLAMEGIFELITDDDIGNDELLALNSDWNCFSELRQRLKGNEMGMKELPQYQSHKIVHALKIHNIDLDVQTGAAVITPAEDGFGPFAVDAAYMEKHKPRIGGYYVVYEGGYKSWSPADAFEKGYTKIDGRDDIAPCGNGIYWADLAKQLAAVWWEVSKLGGTLQHGDLDNAGTMFSVVLEQHGGHCFHGETPMDAWRKAHAWLVSPERPSLAWSAQCDTLLTKLQSVINSGQKRTYEEMKSLADRLTEMGAIVAGTELQEYESERDISGLSQEELHGPLPH